MNGGANLKILAVGDVCSEGGTEFLLKTLPKIKKEYGIDFTVVNGENSSVSNAISARSADLIYAAGADVITGGNHTLHRKDLRPLLDSDDTLLRPDNMPKAEFGKGYCLYDMGHTKIAVINLLGQTYLELHEAENPFTCADRLIERAENDGADLILLDFHAEATSEKVAMGLYLDGRVTAVFGTHTHVQTSDCRVLKNGTAYMTDLGMTGPEDGVLGVKAEIIIDRFKNGGTGRFTHAEGNCVLEGMIIEADKNSGKAISATAVRIK